MITGNETAIAFSIRNADGGYTHYHGLTIFQELSARFMAAHISNGINNDYTATDACNSADALIAEWNEREQNKNL